MARAFTGVRIVLGALFIWAAVTKLPDMAGFAQDVANYRVVPAALHRPSRHRGRAGAPARCSTGTLRLAIPVAPEPD